VAGGRDGGRVFDLFGALVLDSRFEGGRRERGVKKKRGGGTEWWEILVEQRLPSLEISKAPAQVSIVWRPRLQIFIIS
jgi:hypothetical protein